MQAQKVDSVINYLTPKRLLTNIMNPANKTKINRSMADPLSSPSNIDQSHGPLNSTPRKERESYKKKNTQPNIFSTHQDIISGNDPVKIQMRNKNQSVINIKSIAASQVHQTGNQYNDNNKFIIADNEPIGFSSRVSQASKHSKDSANKFKPLSYNEVRSEILAPKKKEFEPVAPIEGSSRKFSISSMKKNPQVSQLVIQDVIKQLMSVKNSLQQEILSLKNLLDDTCTNLELLDSQFQKVKQKILAYTSKALDSAFKQYKKNLPNWSLYENIQKKGIEKMMEINQTIEFCKNEENIKSMGGREAVQNNVQQIKILTQEVRDAKAQCFSQRPFLPEDKIKKLQTTLRELGQF